MHRPSSDFAHPVAKTAGCFVAICALPIALVVSIVSSHPLPYLSFVGSGVLSLAGLGALCGRPSVIRAALSVVADMIRHR